MVQNKIHVTLPGPTSTVGSASLCLNLYNFQDGALIEVAPSNFSSVSHLDRLLTHATQSATRHIIQKNSPRISNWLPSCDLLWLWLFDIFPRHNILFFQKSKRRALHNICWFLKGWKYLEQVSHLYKIIFVAAANSRRPPQVSPMIGIEVPYHATSHNLPRWC